MFGKTFFLLCCVGVIFGMGKQRQSISVDQYTVIHINIVFSKPLNLLLFLFYVMFSTFYLSNLFYSFFLLAIKNSLLIFLFNFFLLCVGVIFGMGKKKAVYFSGPVQVHTFWYFLILLPVTFFKSIFLATVS